MKTFAFIGSDKNAGKTTALNYVYRQMVQSRAESELLCITSIGINGENSDSYDNKSKPSVRILKRTAFITAGEHLSDLSGKYETLHYFQDKVFPKDYILGKARCDFDCVIEGPNDKPGLLATRKVLGSLRESIICLLDGSIDRQFIGHPEVCDGIYFSLLLSDRDAQLRKAKDLLTALSLNLTEQETSLLVEKHKQDNTKSLLLSDTDGLLYHSKTVPFLDDKLKQSLQKNQNEPTTLYLNGALNQSLFKFLSSFKNLAIVLDNFTLYQNVSTEMRLSTDYSLNLSLLHSVPVKKIFIKQESWQLAQTQISELPMSNLFRDNPDEIRI